MNALLLFTFVVGVGMWLQLIYLSWFEWNLHKYVMHKPVVFTIFGRKFVFDYAYKAHHQTHHVTFGSGNSPKYLLQDRKDFWTIPMAWWNWIVLLVFTCLPAILLAWVSGYWWILKIAAAESLLYYATYELMHMLMHHPNLRGFAWFTKTPFFKAWDARHRDHHTNPKTNFNVVWDFTDKCNGTTTPKGEL